ncbi:MAG: transposase [Negativicutes bacterium]
MKSTQNEKIFQIKNETLVVGIAIGKETHYARAFDNRGIELAKLLRFSNTAQGSEALEEWMQSIMQQKEKTEALVEVEPTGHYWFTLADTLQSKGHRLGIVNPFHVKCTRELDDNNQTKSDRKDPKTIAMLVKDRRYRDVYIPADLYQELREAVSERERLQVQLTGISNRVIRWLDIRFSEFRKIFKAWSAKTAMTTLKHLPIPARIVAASAEGVVTFWQGTRKRSSLKKAKDLVQAATTSIGRTAGCEAAGAALSNLQAQYEMIAAQRQGIEELMTELLLRVPMPANFWRLRASGWQARR